MRTEWRPEWIIPPPEPRGRHPPPETIHPLKGKPETGDRRHILRSRVSVVRSLVRVFSIRFRFGPAPLPEPDDPCLIPDQPRPETQRCMSQSTIRFPCAAPLSRDSLLPPSPSPGPSSSPPIHLCTFAQELRSDLHLCTKCSPLSPCHLAHLPPRVSARRATRQSPSRPSPVRPRSVGNQVPGDGR